jgi:endoglucanase
MDTFSDSFNRNTNVADFEREWGNPLTTKANIDAVKNAGFNAIRIPVTWHKAVDDDFNIREDFMARVKQIVDWAVENDMYIILNTHHDSRIFRLSNSNMPQTRRAFTRIWEQIAETFKDYDEKLIFLSLNEPRTYNSPNEWAGGSAEERNNLNILNQLFVDTVRASGGNNAYRSLMIPTHGAGMSDLVMNALVIPDDTVPDRIIVSLHSYAPMDFTFPMNNRSTWSVTNFDDTSQIRSRIDLAYSLFVSKGVPVIIGEWGSVNKNNIAARAAHAEYYVSYAKSRGIPTFWWDNGDNMPIRWYEWGYNEPFAILNRHDNTWIYPEIVEAIMRGIK